MEDQKKEEPMTPDPEKRKLAIQDVIESMKNVMEITSRTARMFKMAVEFMEQKGILDEFDDYAQDIILKETAN